MQELTAEDLASIDLIREARSFDFPLASWELRNGKENGTYYSWVIYYYLGFSVQGLGFKV